MPRTVLPETNRHLAYHAMQIARQRFGRELGTLDEQQGAEIMASARTSFELESRVLAAVEARGVDIPDSQLDTAMETIRARYDSSGEFLDDLARNGLDEPTLRCSLRRQLLFDAVMQSVAASAPAVTEADLRLFYELHRDRFQAPEVRNARHILITVNPDFVENTYEQARRRIGVLARQVRAQPSRFETLARRHSECPTAADGGKLGAVTRGQLYPALDRALFELSAGAVSDVVESEMGLHLVLCERVQAGRRVSFRKVQTRVREVVEQRTRRLHLKVWLASLAGDPAPPEQARADEQRARRHG